MKLYHHLLFLFLIQSTHSTSNQSQAITQHDQLKGISYKKLISILHTESNKEFYSKSILQKDNILWQSLTDFEWKILNDSKDETKYHSFILCSTAKKSSKDRHEQLVHRLKNDAYIQPFYVKPSESCYILHSTLNKCKEIYKKEKNIKIQPLSYSMKILSGGIDLINTVWNDKEEDTTLKEVRQLKPSSDTKSNSSTTKKDTIQKPFLTINAALCPNNYEKISKQHENYHHFIRKTILEYSLDVEKVEKHFFWYHYNDEISERALFWNSTLDKWSAHQCRDVLNDIRIDFENDVPLVKSKKVTIPIVKITFPYKPRSKSCVYQFVLSLSLQNFICSVQVQSKLRTFNHNVQWLVQTGVKDTTPWYDLGIDGTNQIIGVSDTGVDTNHCYFINNSSTSLRYGRVGTIDTSQRKIVQYDDFVNRDDYQYGHGTHVVGSLVGLKVGDDDVSNMDTTDPGIAPNAKVAFIDIGTDDGSLILPSLSRVLETGYANIHSASWGNTYNGYGLYSVQFDSYVYYINDELLPVVAAGNDGKPHTTCEPANAKNVIAVGSAHSYGNDLQDDMKGPGYISYFSSQGPTVDLRTKPDIIAPGHYVSSAAAHAGCDPDNGESPDPNHATQGLVSFAGTSMATPMVAASSALLRQYLQDGYYPSGTKNSSDSISNPSSALIKGIIMNGAQYLFGVDKENGDVQDVHPYDNIQNYGRVSLVDTLYIKDKSNVQVQLWDREEISTTDDPNVYTVTIDTSGGCTNEKLSITLSYTDPPGTSGCIYCLIHDLDLLVQSKQLNKTYYPNGKTSPDYLNNIERVIIDNVKHNDTFEILITATTLVKSKQSYSLVASGCFGGTGNTIDMSKTVYVEEDDDGHVDWSLITIILFAIVGACGCCYVMKRQQSIDDEILNQGDVYVIQEVVTAQEPLLYGSSN